MDAEDDRQRGVDLGERLEDPRVARLREALAAVLLVDVEAAEPRVAELADDVVADPAVLLDLAMVDRRADLARPRAQLTDLALLLLIRGRPREDHLLVDLAEQQGLGERRGGLAALGLLDDAGFHAGGSFGSGRPSLLDGFGRVVVVTWRPGVAGASGRLAELARASYDPRHPLPSRAGRSRPGSSSKSLGRPRPSRPPHSSPAKRRYDLPFYVWRQPRLPRNAPSYPKPSTRSATTSASASAEVAAGEGALRTWTACSVSETTKSSTSDPSPPMAWARTPAI